MEERTDFKVDDYQLTTDEELKESEDFYKKMEEEGKKNILKYFDRIHDKLFAFNNILIVGFFALSKIDTEISVKTILIPIANLTILIYIEYRMMEKSRYEAEIMKKKIDDIVNYGQSIDNTTLYSLLTILTTSIVAFFFIYLLIF